MPLQLDPVIIQSTDLLTLHDQHTLAEEHAVPGASPEEYSTYTIPASALVYLREKPKQLTTAVPTGVSVVQVPGGPFAEVLTSPSAGQFSVNYTAGIITFNAADVGKDVVISYIAQGSLIRASHINNINNAFFPLYENFSTITVTGITPLLNFTFPNDVTVTGDLNVVGVVNKMASEVLDFSDDILLINSGETSAANAGVEIHRTGGGTADPQLIWNESSLTWNFYSTDTGPTATQGYPLLAVYNKGGVRGTRLTLVQEAALTGTLGAGDGGLQWFNTDTSQFMGWNGAAAVILG